MITRINAYNPNSQRSSNRYSFGMSSGFVGKGQSLTDALCVLRRKIHSGNIIQEAFLTPDEGAGLNRLSTLRVKHISSGSSIELDCSDGRASTRLTVMQGSANNITNMLKKENENSLVELIKQKSASASDYLYNKKLND